MTKYSPCDQLKFALEADDLHEQNISVNPTI